MRRKFNKKGIFNKKFRFEKKKRICVIDFFPVGFERLLKGGKVGKRWRRRKWWKRNCFLAS